MPFARPWRHYKPGDLLYGLAQNRGRLAAFFKINQGAVYTIDQYGIMSDDQAATLAQNKLKFDREFIEALENGDKTRGIVDTDLNDASFWNADRNNAINIAKRKCKAGLEYITQHTEHHIHFCLDGMNMVQVANKNYDGKAGGVADSPGKWTGKWNEKARSITGAELRWVYRNRFNPRVQSRIQFWKLAGSSWVACPPPWDDGDRTQAERNAFASYKPTAVTVSVLAAVDAALRAYDNKIHWFFAHSDESKNALPKLVAALKSGDAARVLATVCYYLNVKAAKGTTPAAPGGLGAKLQSQSHLYRYLYTELNNSHLVN
jgi:hypothetical protein